MTQTAYQDRLGARMREVRQRLGLSLPAVHALSGGRFHQATVGAWERGARSVTVERLAELARFYDVPVTDLLPPGAAA